MMEPVIFETGPNRYNNAWIKFDAPTYLSKLVIQVLDDSGEEVSIPGATGIAIDHVNRSGRYSTYRRMFYEFDCMREGTYFTSPSIMVINLSQIYQQPLYLSENFALDVMATGPVPTRLKVFCHLTSAPESNIRSQIPSSSYAFCVDKTNDTPFSRNSDEINLWTQITDVFITSAHEINLWDVIRIDCVEDNEIKVNEIKTWIIGKVFFYQVRLFVSSPQSTDPVKINIVDDDYCIRRVS